MQQNLILKCWYQLLLAIAKHSIRNNVAKNDPKQLNVGY